MLTVWKSIVESLLSTVSMVWTFTKSLHRKCRSCFLSAVRHMQRSPSVVSTRQLTYFLHSCIFIYVGVDDIQAGFYVKEDGRVNPVDVTMALAKGTVLTQTVARSNHHSSCEPY